MDYYEVFMLTRMREAYDETRATPRSAVAPSGSRGTGKLVTSAALVLMFAFFVLSSGRASTSSSSGWPRGGIIFDATVIRALLVPALMRLLGRWNWWMPRSAARVLFIDVPANGSKPLTDPA